MSILASLAAVVVAALQNSAPASAAQATNEPPELTELKAEINTHRILHVNVDVRTVVFAVYFGTALSAMIKDGKGLITPSFLDAHVWVCVAGLIAVGFAMMARFGMNDYRRNGRIDPVAAAQRNVVRMHSITRRKVWGHNISLGIMILDAALIALAITLS